MNISSALKSYLSDGSAIWNGFEITSEFPHQFHNVLHNSWSSKFIQLFDIKLCSVKTCVFAFEDYKCNENSLNNGIPLSFHENISPLDINYFNKSKLLDISSMQTFLTLLLHSEVNLVLKSLPMLLFCDGFENKENIFMVYLEEHHFDTPSSLRKNNSSCCSFILVKTVKCEGCLPIQAWKIDMSKNNFKSDEQIVKHYCNMLALPMHIQLAKENISSNSLFSIESFAQFELFNENISHMQSFNQLPVASISIDVSCNKISRLFAIDSVHISSITVNVSPIPGDFRSPAHCLFKDIDVLEGLLQGFGHENNVQWSDFTCDSDQEVNTDSIDNIQESLKDVFQYFNSYAVLQDTKSNKSDQSDDEEVLNLIIQRQELDFTEKIWNVLKYVQSFQQLVNCLSMVFSEIWQGKAEQFWLHEDSDSLLAKEIKNSYQGKFSNKPLVGLLPLQILVEIGIDKLRRDYINFFVRHRYCSAARLQSFTTSVVNDNVADQLLFKFSGLKKLHHITELAAYCHTYLQLPSANIQKVVRSALQEYSQSDLDFKKTFSFPASYNDVRLHLDGCVPSFWKMSVCRSAEQGKCSGIACWTTSFPFTGLFDPLSHDLDSYTNGSFTHEENDADSAIYYMTTITESLYPIITN